MSQLTDPVERGQADQAGDLPAVELAQLGQLRREGGGGGDADAPHPQHVRKKFVSQAEFVGPHADALNSALAIRSLRPPGNSLRAT